MGQNTFFQSRPFLSVKIAMATCHESIKVSSYELIRKAPEGGAPAPHPGTGSGEEKVGSPHWPQGRALTSFLKIIFRAASPDSVGTRATRAPGRKVTNAGGDPAVSFLSGRVERVMERKWQEEEARKDGLKERRAGFLMKKRRSSFDTITSARGAQSEALLSHELSLDVFSRS